MSAKKKSKPAPAAAATSKERRASKDRRAPSPPLGLNLTIAAVGLRELSLRELPQTTATGRRVLGLPIPQVKMSLNAALDFPEERAATLTLAATVVDGAPEPIVELTLKVSAVFLFQEGVSKRDVADYLNRMGGGIVFPYIRETVHSVMARSIFGTILLPPTIVTPLFTDAQLSTIVQA